MPMPLPTLTPRPEVSTAEAARSLMSALADGDAAALEGGCALWRDEAGARSAWHAYHLIGDVLRSDDLARQPRRDAEFLATLRTRLAQEPVPLAPTVVAATVDRSTPWRLPLAAAAGVAAVAGVLALTQTATSDGGAAVAFGGLRDGAVTLASGNGAASPTMVQGRMVRDPQIDAYLRIHRQMAGGAVTPGGVPRSMETLAPLTQPGR